MNPPLWKGLIMDIILLFTLSLFQSVFSYKIPIKRFKVKFKILMKNR